MDQDLGHMLADAFWQAVGSMAAAASEWAATHPWQATLLAAGCIALIALSAAVRRRRA